jgi:hypothetical protein
MQFTLTGFRQETGVRVFAFEGTAEDHSRTAYTVRTDLALTRQYGIQLQELPLLCRALLERCDDRQEHSLTFTEEDMQLHATGRAAQREAAQRRKAPRRPPARTPQAAHQPGSEWRGFQRSPVD